jgi:hypothetical protein
MSDDDIGLNKRAALLHQTELLGEATREYNELIEALKSRDIHLDKQAEIDALKERALEIDDALSNPSPIPLTEDERFARVLAMIELATEQMEKINQELRELLPNRKPQ